MLTGAAALLALSLAAAFAGPLRDEERAAGRFNSAVPFRVWAVVDDHKRPQLVGETPAEAPLTMPPCRWWLVEPLPPVDMKVVVREVRDRGIPGLSLRLASDDDLAHVKELKALQMLDLEETKVTDAGVAQLKGLKGLHTLGLSWTKVTDAGVEELRKSLPHTNISR